MAQAVSDDAFHKDPSTTAFQMNASTQTVAAKFKPNENGTVTQAEKDVAALSRQAIDLVKTNTRMNATLKFGALGLGFGALGVFWFTGGREMLQARVGGQAPESKEHK